MDFAPIDLRQQQFRTAFRGFDKMEVASFLLMVADHYEQALRETERMRHDVARLEALVNEYRQHERSLQSTLLAAQQVADGIKANAEQQAEGVIRDAQNRSSLILDTTQARLEELQREVNGLRLKRRDVETTIESTIQALRHALDYVREQETQERDDKILLHRARNAEPGSVQPPGRAESQAVGN